jgi:hypothetical protein
MRRLCVDVLMALGPYLDWETLSALSRGNRLLSHVCCDLAHQKRKDAAVTNLPTCYDRIAAMEQPYRWSWNLNDTRVSVPWHWSDYGAKKRALISHNGDIIDSLLIQGVGITKVRICTTLNSVELFRSYHLSNFCPVIAMMFEDVFVEVTAKSVTSIQVRFGSLDNVERRHLAMSTYTLRTVTGRKVTFEAGVALDGD